MTSIDATRRFLQLGLIAIVLAIPTRGSAETLRELLGFGISCTKCDDRGSQTYEIRHVASQQYIDAHVTASEGFRVVNRDRQRNDTQYWIVTFLPGDELVVIQQEVNRQFLEADHGDGNLVRTTAQWKDNSSQHWRPLHVGNNRFLLQQVSSGRFLDVENGHNAQLVTDRQSNSESQRWEFSKVP